MRGLCSAVIAAFVVTLPLFWLFPAKHPLPQPVAWCVIPARSAIRIGGRLYLFDFAQMLPCRLLPIERSA